MMPATLSIITNAFPAHERGKAIGTWAGVSAIALAIGPLVGGWLVEHLSWQAIFYINVPVAIARRRHHAVGRARVARRVRRALLDFPGVISSASAWARSCSRSSRATRGAGPRLGVLGLLAARSAPRLVRAHRAPGQEPMLDFSYFRSRTFLGANLVAFLVTFAMFGMFLFIALYMQNVLGYSPLEAGVRFLPTTLVVMFLGPSPGRLSDRIGPRPLMVGGLATVAVALFWQSLHPGRHLATCSCSRPSS